jgi:aminomethyltransferase
MRRSPVRDLLAAHGAVFSDRDGAEIAASFGDRAAEYNAVRNGIGLTDLSNFLIYRGLVDDALYPLDESLSGNVASIRFGRVQHTLLLDEAGLILADVYVVCGEEDLLVLCEPCAPADEIDRRLIRPDSALRNITDSTALFGLDGPRSWFVPRELFGRDTLGMPYLSVEDHRLGDVPVQLIRAGKTAEFGYLVMVPAEAGAATWERLKTAGTPQGLLPCGLDVHDDLKLDGRFFNVNREGRRVRDPLVLGLQWMIDFQKDVFIGREAVLARREAGPAVKIVGIALGDGLVGLSIDDVVTLDGVPAGSIVTHGWSGALGREMGLALMNVDVAFSGLDVVVDGAKGPLNAETISLPPFVPRSLTVKLDEI